MDYRSQVIEAHNHETGRFDSTGHVDCCRVIGAAVEASLKLAYRPQVGRMVVPLVQSASNLTSVVFQDVNLARERRVVKRLLVQVFPDDAAFALRIVTESMKRLQKHPYNLKVCATHMRFCSELGNAVLNPRF